MADIKLKRSSSPGSVPTNSQLSLGELALNTFDGSVFLKSIRNADSSILNISGRGVFGGTGAPSVAPVHEGSIYIDSTNDAPYIGIDTLSSADYKNIFDRTNHTGKIQQADVNFDSTLIISRFVVQRVSPEFDMFDLNPAQHANVIRWDWNNGTFGAQLRSYDSISGGAYINNMLTLRTDSFGMDRLTVDMDSHSIIFDKAGTSLRSTTDGIMSLGAQNLRFKEGFFNDISLKPSKNHTPTIDGEVNFSAPARTRLTFQYRDSLSNTRTFEIPRLDSSGNHVFNSYGVGTKTGTATYLLGVDSFGSVVETNTSGGSGVSWSDPVNASLIPSTSSSYDVGDSITTFKAGYFDSIYISGFGINTLTNPSGAGDQIAFYDSSQSQIVYGTPTNGVEILNTSIQLTTNARMDAIQFVIDGGGSAITTGLKGYLEIPYDCTIQQARALLDQSGGIKVDVWKDTYANYPPDSLDTITATAEITVNNTNKSEDTNLTGWTTSVSAGDILAFNVDSVKTATFATVSLEVIKT